MENSTVVDTFTTILPNVVRDVAKLSFSWYDYILFSLMLSLSAMIGVYFGCFGTKQATADEYLMGNKKMKVFPISVSLVASHVSGITLLAVPADVYRFGASYWLIVPAVFVAATVTDVIFLPVFFKLGITSTYEYLEKRFDNSNRVFASFLFTLGVFLYLPIVIYIPALAFSAATGINVHLITPIVCGVCIFYTTLGGLKAVVWTDTLQFTVTVGAVITVFILGIKSAGGFGAVWDTAIKGHRLDIFDFDPDPTMRDSFWISLTGNAFLWISLIGIHQSCVQKFLSVPTLAQAKLTVILCCIGLSIIASFSVLTGLIMYSKYANCDPFTTGAVQKNDQLLPYYIMDVASHIPGLPGLFIAGIFCAALSTLSATLNCLAGTMYEDFLVKFIRPKTEKSAACILKLIVVTAGVICTALVFILEHLGGILPLVFSLGGVTNGPLLGMFTLGVLFPKASSKGTLCGSIFGLLFSCWLVITAQYYKSQGYLQYPPKPTTVDGCLANMTTMPTTLTDLSNVSSYAALNATHFIDSESSIAFADDIGKYISNNTEEEVEDPDEFQPFFLFRVSYYYYGPLGTVVTIIVALLISYCVGNDDPPVHRDLISPIVHFLLSDEKVSEEKNKDYYSLDKALHLVTTNNDKDKSDLNY